MKNVYLMCLPRSGSTYFFKLMEQSPDIVCSYREPFNLVNLTPSEYYSECTTLIDNIKRNTGVLVKDTLTHVNLFDDSDVTKLFLNFYQYVSEHFYLVKLYRRDIFDQALSNCIAELTGDWATPVGKYKFDLVTVPVENLKHVLDSHKRYREFLKNFCPFDKIIYYEDLISSCNLTTDWVFDFLAQPAELKPMITTQNPPKNKIVINYNELVDWYEKHKTEYEMTYDN